MLGKVQNMWVKVNFNYRKKKIYIKSTHCGECPPSVCDIVTFLFTNVYIVGFSLRQCIMFYKLVYFIICETFSAK